MSLFLLENNHIVLMTNSWLRSVQMESRFIVAGIWQNIGSSCVSVGLCFLQPQHGMAGIFLSDSWNRWTAHFEKGHWE